MYPLPIHNHMSDLSLSHKVHIQWAHASSNQPPETHYNPSESLAHIFSLQNLALHVCYSSSYPGSLTQEETEFDLDF